MKPPMKSLLLAVDSGNTNVKWGLHDGSGWSKRGVVAQGNKALLEREWQDTTRTSAHYRIERG